MFNIRLYLWFLLASVGLSLLFWWPLFVGHGFIGGDLYPYFFPQKVFYSDSLRAGVLPLWNDLTGFGYPVLGESQTGAAYPFHLVLYRCFSVNTAYNIEHLLHYGFCFVGTALLAVRLQITTPGALLAALVFTYGWFPPRACLEWAILTGCWLPVALYCVESFVQTRLWRYAIGLSVTLGLQLLAGHFHLAFITHLMVASFALWRLWIGPPGSRTIDHGMVGCRKGAMLTALALAGIAGIGIAGIQLLPAWELKQRSSRVVTSSDYDPAYGHMPPLYVTQLVAPWCWYSPQAITEDNLVRTAAELTAPWLLLGPNHDLDQAIRQARFAALETGTNKVEAHVYCGLIPLILAFFSVCNWARRFVSSQGQSEPTSLIQATTGYWLLAGVLALVYATGWLLPIGMSLPGFSFFRGPGRYGIVTTLAVALLAGQRIGYLLHRPWPGTIKSMVFAAVFASTAGDLWLVSRMVTYTYLVSQPAMTFRDTSPVRQLLMGESQFPRLLAPGPNVGTLLGVSCVPWYLGIAPAEYVDPRYAMPDLPKPLPSGRPTPSSAPLLEWLSQSGVTHVLNFEPLDKADWGVELLWKGVDPFLNRIWGRPEPIHLYRFRKDANQSEAPQFPGRARLGGTSIPVMTASRTREADGSRRIVVDATLAQPETLILTELAYPGWTVERNGQPLESKQVGQFRAVECPPEGGEILWRYRPLSVFFGAGLSMVSVLVLAAVGHLRFWHPRLIDRILGTKSVREEPAQSASLMP